MNCPKCNGEGINKATYVMGNISYRRKRCKCCGVTYFEKAETVTCDSEEFYEAQRKYGKDRYRRECMRRYQGVTV